MCTDGRPCWCAFGVHVSFSFRNVGNLFIVLPFCFVFSPHRAVSCLIGHKCFIGPENKSSDLGHGDPFLEAAYGEAQPDYSLSYSAISFQLYKIFIFHLISFSFVQLGKLPKQSNQINQMETAQRLMNLSLQFHISYLCRIIQGKK